MWVDCDVIQADGGTRTAAITGGFIAVADAITRIPGLQPTAAIRDCVAAISVGVVHGQAMLDLNYVEDSSAEVDMNVVMTGAGEFVEVQGTAEQVPFGRARLDALLAIAEGGIRRLVVLQRRALEARAERAFSQGHCGSSAVDASPPAATPLLVLATLNPAKGRELQALLGAVPFRVRLVSEFPGARLPEETGQTYAENALVKARAAAHITGALSLGDDSGLEVDALGGAPGLHTARFGGPGLADAGALEALARAAS